MGNEIVFCSNCGAPVVVSRYNIMIPRTVHAPRYGMASSSAGGMPYWQQNNSRKV